MVFSMPVWRKISVRLKLLWLVFLCLSTPVYAASEGFTIRSVDTVLREEVYLLNSRIDYAFSEEALKALQSGVPLILLVDIEVERMRPWWLNENIATLQQGYLLIYHALTEKYIVNNLNSGAQSNYSNLDSALTALGRLDSLPILDANLLEAEQKYQVRLRVRLDIDSLPAPMQPLAYLSPQWRLESDWYTWPLQR